MPAIKSQQIMPPPRAHFRRKVSEQEYLDWLDEDECNHGEWVNGAIEVFPPEYTHHNMIAGFVLVMISAVCCQKNIGRVFAKNVHVRNASLRTRRVPDVMFIAKSRSEIIEYDYINGSPDLIVEVVSSDSPARDYREKYFEYEKAGVREYWIVNPLANHVEAYSLVKGKFQPIKSDSGMVRSTVVPGFYFKEEWLVAETFPNWITILKEMGIR